MARIVFVHVEEPVIVPLCALAIGTLHRSRLKKEAGSYSARCRFGLEWPAATCADPGGASIDQESEAKSSNLKHGTRNLARWNEHS